MRASRAASRPCRASTVARPRPQRSSTVTPAGPMPSMGARSPAKADRGDRIGTSGMETNSLRIDEDGRTDLHLDVAVAHRVVGADPLADALRTPRDRKSVV